jgi:hypothetical protein
MKTVILSNFCLSEQEEMAHASKVCDDENFIANVFSPWRTIVSVHIREERKELDKELIVVKIKIEEIPVHKRVIQAKGNPRLISFQ